ncbi:MAG: hypothetical protein ACRDTG_19700 [Pseudonocardiaceae bacterium]
MDYHAERVLVPLDDLSTSLYCICDDQVRLDGVSQDSERRG